MIKRGFVSLLVLAAFALLAMGSFGKSDDEKAKEEEAKGTAKIGETISFEDSEWVVLDAKDVGSTLKSNNQFQEDRTSADGKFVQVHFKITNKSKKEEMLFLPLNLIDGEKNEFKELDERAFYVPAKAKTLGMEALPVGLSREFWTVFEVPKKATNFKFRTRKLKDDSDTKLVELGF